PLMKWIIRPAVLVAAAVLLLGAAAWLVLQAESVPAVPRPLAVEAGTREVAWLYPATSGTAWERLVLAIKRAADRLGLEAVETRADASSPLAVPEASLRWPGGALVFRWYKLTSAWRASAWAEALAGRSPPPAAVISGSSTHWAREVALALRAQQDRLPEDERPLLLLTSATADNVSVSREEEESGPPLERARGQEGEPVRLHSLYKGRTFRFCFTNRQMASALTRFVWSSPDLRPDADPAFLVQWTDDSYSRDLFAGYQRVLDWRASDNVLQQAFALAGRGTVAAPPFAYPAWFASGFRHTGSQQMRIDSSVAPVASPNPFEARAVRDLLDVVARGEARRPLLAVTGQAGPTRRFLRDLARSAPLTARSFVVVAGDSIGFDTVFRDRMATWPVQELPFDLVFFCHRDPVSAEAGFDPRAKGGTNGTEGVLLYQDIVESLALASRSSDDLKTGLEMLNYAVGRATTGPGVPLFDKEPRRQGMRQEGTGEHAVRLRPEFDGERVLPRAALEVWVRSTEAEGLRWRRAAPVLEVGYDGEQAR
ncbi:MAG: hypothetical protein K2W96_04060, partial [Gemmataceae bacterium]|nr:hypothetical protein [Gemmataceae bacterium]